MLHFIKLQAPIQVHQNPKQVDVSQTQRILSSTSPSILKQCSKFSRRELTLFTNSSLLVLVTTHIVDPHLLLKARADENPEEIRVENDQQEGDSTAKPDDGNLQESVAENGQQVAEDNETKVEENPQETSTEVDQPEAKDNATKAEENPQETSAEIDQQESETTSTQGKETPPETGAKNDQQEDESNLKNAYGCNDRTPTQRAFFDVSIDGKPAGRITIGLFGESAPVGAARFSDLVSGRAGISFRRKDFVKIMPNYVQHGGIRSYGVDAELAGKTGRSLTNERLLEEWERLSECQGTKNLAGTISIIVRDPSKPPPKMKLVARQGKLEIDQEEVGVEPNGTEFTIATRDSPELDSSALVIGKVIEGMSVVEKIGQVKTVQDNTSSPYFRAAKLIGDKRAVVAERGFNRPYSKVTITNCGLVK